MKLLTNLLLAASLGASCDSNLKVKTAETLLSAEERHFEVDGTSSTEGAAKLNTADCIDPNLKNLSSAETITLCDGTLARGELDLSNVVPENITNLMWTKDDGTTRRAGKPPC